MPNEASGGVRRDRRPFLIALLALGSGLALTVWFKRPAAVSSRRLPGFKLTADGYGWAAKLPAGSPRLLGHEITVKLDTRETPDEPRILPPVREEQARLLRRILPTLPELVRKAEAELIGYDDELKDPKFRQVVRSVELWLPAKPDSEVDWALVVERSDMGSFGYHVEFSGLEFREVWAAD